MREVMKVDFFENGLCFYCHLARNELLSYSEFNSRTEALWKREDEALQKELEGIIEKYPEASREEIVDSYAWDLHVNQYKYPDIHRSALVVAVYVFLEDQLNGLCSTIGESLKSPLRLTDISGMGVERALLFLSKVANFDLGRISSLSFVKEVGRLRNKMVHAGGVLPVQDNDKLNKFVQRTDGLRGEPGDRVYIQSEFVSSLIGSFVLFFDELDSEVQKFMTAVQLME